MSPSPPSCIIIVGPTAVGKTAVAIELAKKLNTSVISADSRQCYRELNIGVGKPSPDQLRQVKHYFINSHSVEQEVNAATFEQYALASANEIFHEHNQAIVAGGTGLYVDAFCNGMDDVPVITPGTRELIIADYEANGLAWLQAQVRTEDPEYFNNGEVHNPQRLMRALEVKRSTGNSIRNFHTREQKPRDFSTIKIGLELPRGTLYAQINHRVDGMMDSGLENEVQNLLPYRHQNALNTVGYKELFSYLDGTISLVDAIGLIKKNTRHYAKRQMTWFKKDTSIRWFHPSDLAGIVNLLNL